MNKAGLLIETLSVRPLTTLNRATLTRDVDSLPKGLESEKCIILGYDDMPKRRAEKIAKALGLDYDTREMFSWKG